MNTSIRDAQFLNVYGVGSMIEVDQQVVMPTWKVNTVQNQIIEEPLLVQRLKHRGYEQLQSLHKLPVIEDDEKGEPAAAVNSVIFPQWMYCSKCGRLDSYKNWRNGWLESLQNIVGKSLKDKEYKLQKLATRFERMPMCCHCRGDRIYRIPRLIPANYVSICEHGHIDDFPWHSWCHNNKPHPDGTPVQLYFVSHGELNKQKVRCSCGAEASMADLLGKAALEKKGLKCSGAMPWRGYNKPDNPFHCESCNATPIAVQRNGTNVRFPRTMSAFSVPMREDADKEQVSASKHWESIKAFAAKGESYDMFVPFVVEELAMPENRVKAAIKTLLNNGEVVIADQDYEKFEYDAFLNALSSPEKYFEVQKIPELNGCPQWLKCLNKVVRLREISVPISFTRVFPDQGSVPEADQEQPQANQIEVKEQFVAELGTNKLYACEGFGEGIFISFDTEVLTAWYEANQDRLSLEYRDLIRGMRHGNGEKKHVLLKTAIHTLVHCLMIQMSVDSGYALTALRERIYCSADGDEYYGALIYTTSPDKCGTLGGVSRYADKDEFMVLLKKALAFSEHCDNDPLCSDHPSGRSSKSSCFACVFIPETSCSHFNQWLDRKLVRNEQTSRRPWTGLFDDEGISATVEWPTEPITDEDPVPGCSYILEDGTEIWGYDACNSIDKSKLKFRISDENN